MWLRRPPVGGLGTFLVPHWADSRGQERVLSSSARAAMTQRDSPGAGRADGGLTAPRLQPHTEPSAGRVLARPLDPACGRPSGPCSSHGLLCTRLRCPLLFL